MPDARCRQSGHGELKSGIRYQASGLTIAVAKTDDSVYGARESEYPKEEQ